MDRHNFLSARQPLSAIENVTPKKTIAIPKLKSASLKLVANHPPVSTMFYNELRNVIKVFVHDQAAATLANGYINCFENEAVSLRERIAVLEGTLNTSKFEELSLTKPTSQSSRAVDAVYKQVHDDVCDNSKSFVDAVAAGPKEMEITKATDENLSPESLESAAAKSIIHLNLSAVNSPSNQILVMRRSTRRASISTVFPADKPVTEREPRQIRQKIEGEPVKDQDYCTAVAIRRNDVADDSSRQHKSPRNYSSATPNLKQQCDMSMLSSVINEDASTSIWNKPVGRCEIPKLVGELAKGDATSYNSNIVACEEIVALPYGGKVVQSRRKDASSKYSKIDATGASTDHVAISMTECSLAEKGGQLAASYATNELQEEKKCESSNDFTHVEEGNCPVDYDDSEVYGVLMFDSVPDSNFSGENSMRSSPQDTLKSRLTDRIEENCAASKGRAGRKEKCSEALVTSRRTSGRFRIKPSRFLDEEELGGKSGVTNHSEPCHKKDSSKNDLRGKAQKGRVTSCAVLKAVQGGETPIKNLVSSNDHNPSQVCGVALLDAAESRESAGNQFMYVDDEVDEFSAVMRMSCGISRHHSLTHSASTTESNPTQSRPRQEIHDDNHMESCSDPEDYIDNGLLHWCCDDTVSAPLTLTAPSSSFHASCTSVDNKKQRVSELVPHRQSYSVSLLSRQCVEMSTDQFVRTEETDKLLNDSTAPSALQSASQMISRSQSGLSQSSLASVGMAFTTLLVSFLTTSQDSSCTSDTLSTLALGLATLVEYLDCSEEQPPPPAVGSKKSVRFCDVDGSCVAPPGKDCAHEPALQTVRRLHSLLGRIDEILQLLFKGSNSADSPHMLDTVLRCCQQLADPATAAVASKAMQESLHISASSGEVAAIASMFSSELCAAKGAHSPSLSCARTVLRHRTAWMATAVLRAQLRWLLDPPPAHVSVPSVSGHPLCLIHRSDLHKMLTLSEDVCPVTDVAKKKRRKSDVVVIDHTALNPTEMTLSSLLTHALRQIYDAFSAAVASSPSQDADAASVDMFVTKFLTAGVTSHTEIEGVPSLEGLELSQPQLALAAQRATSFVGAFLSFPAVHDCIVKEEAVWGIVRESAQLIGQHGMSEDRHLCLFAGGWEGLSRFSQRRLLSPTAEDLCVGFIAGLECSRDEIGRRCDSDEDAMLLNNSFIFDFPRLSLVSLPN